MEPWEILQSLERRIGALQGKRRTEVEDVELRTLEGDRARMAALVGSPAPPDPRYAHGASRFAGEGATPEALRAMAAGDETGGSLALRSAPRGPRGGPGFGMAKAMAEASNSAGGYLVERELADEVLRGLRARSVVRRMGVTTVQVKKEMAITSISTGAAAYYVAENANIPVSELTLAQAPLLQPKALAEMVPVSNRLLEDASEHESLDQSLRTDISETMALREDVAFIQGTGTGVEPKGIKNQSGLTPAPSLGANGGQPSFDNLKDMVAALRLQNGPFAKPGWLFNARTLNWLEKIKTSDGHYLGERDDLLSFDPTGGGGTLLKFPFLTTPQIPTTNTVGTSSDCSYILFSSDWQEAWVGENQELRIELSREASYKDGNGEWQTAFGTDQTLFRAITRSDIALRRPQLFSCMTGVRP